jgi:hypothetical protein
VSLFAQLPEPSPPLSLSIDAPSPSLPPLVFIFSLSTPIFPASSPHRRTCKTGDVPPSTFLGVSTYRFGHLMVLTKRLRMYLNPPVLALNRQKTHSDSKHHTARTPRDAEVSQLERACLRRELMTWEPGAPPLSLVLALTSSDSHALPPDFWRASSSFSSGQLLVCGWRRSAF